MYLNNPQRNIVPEETNSLQKRTVCKSHYLGERISKENKARLSTPEGVTVSFSASAYSVQCQTQKHTAGSCEVFHHLAACCGGFPLGALVPECKGRDDRGKQGCV